MKASPELSAPARARCPRCARPLVTCYCAHVTPLPSQTRVVLLQHPREQHVAIGTARMASLCLPNSELHVGFEWSQSPELARALSDPMRPAALLYPGPGAVDVLTDPPATPVTLVVIDGTWSQTRKLLQANPVLAALPRLAFTPAEPSEYRIRREPHESFVSTIEALAYVLEALEHKPNGYRALLNPFRAMVDTQLDYVARLGAPRVKRPRGPHPKRKAARLVARVPTLLRERAADLVCVVAEAIVWPYADRGPNTAVDHPNELIHWVALRLSTGERFECVVAPTHELARNTSQHTQLSPEIIAAGVPVARFVHDWREWVRDADVLCAWGTFSLELLRGAGAFEPATTLDLRELAHLESGHVVRAAASLCSLLGIVPEGVDGPAFLGRAGARLTPLVAVARHFSAEPSVGSGETPVEV